MTDRKSEQSPFSEFIELDQAEMQNRRQALQAMGRNVGVAGLVTASLLTARRAHAVSGGEA